jgi:isoleucyl-tRNA synthetase
VSLDTAVTPELEAEGLARDLVRAIQQVRAISTSPPTGTVLGQLAAVFNALSLAVSNRIKLTIDAPENVLSAARAHEKLVRNAGEG